ncbi:MAG: TAXI family TRAP transporter solute-binding subunit, partial [Acetobacteraceae bacterium]
MRNIKRRTVLGSFAGVLAAPAFAQKLPSSSVWTAYDLGSSGYVEASAIAEALMKTNDIKVRIVPSGTSIGRMLPLKQGRATYGYLANELYFSTEGLYDFAAQSWGPQDVRIVLGRPSTNGLAMAKDTGVVKMSDIKGKRIGYVKGNPSVNVKNEAYIAFAGLTENDIEKVWFGSYNAMKTAIINNQLDAFSSVTTSANMREIEASPRGLTWPPFPAEDKEAWARMNKVLDFLEPRRETLGAAIPPGGAQLIGIRYPMITTYAATSADEVYAMCQAVEANMPAIKAATGTGDQWNPKYSGLPRGDAPWHEGTIRYMKEKGWWTDDAQKWQDARLARLKLLLAAWPKAQEEFKKAGKGSSDEAWEAFWLDY